MQTRLDRAKQFLAFESLKGYRNLVRNKNCKKIDKKLLFDDSYNELDNTFKKIKKDLLIRVKYYSDDQYIESTGRVKKIDIYRRKIYFLKSIIDMDNIIEIDIIDNIDV